MKTPQLKAETKSTMDSQAFLGGRNEAKRRGKATMGSKALLLAALSSAPLAMAQNCIPLQGSKMCHAFQSASISTSSNLTGHFPFLSFVKDRKSFDDQLSTYVQTSYVQEKYQTLLGCQNINLSNTSDHYARFSTTVICNAIIQMSIEECRLSPEVSRPVCAETCAQFAQSEAMVVANPQLCANPGSNVQPQIRADFINCALPANALSNCIQGISNEPENCGYGNSTIGLCGYCSSGGINSTDTCCYNSNIKERCAGVVLPSIIPTMTFPAPEPTSTATTTSTPVAGGSRGLSGGAIAGIVVGSIVGAGLLAALVFACLLCLRRRRGKSQDGSIFNQPSPARKTPPMAQSAPNSSSAQQYPSVLPGGRIARMSALEGNGHNGHSRDASSRHGHGMGAAAVGAAAGYGAGRRRGADDHSSSDGFGDSPDSEHRAVGVLRPPPASALRRNGSLSSGSVLAGEDPQSPTSGGMSSPQGMASQQSEQLPFFKDYYSQDDIHPGDRVAVLWAYQPRAADEFTLDRGDMLKVVGIWDDGWATGVMMDERAEEWEARRQAQRDSGVSNTSGRGRDESPPVSGEIKAFPLVCVCLPEHWRKTIEGDGSTETGSSAHHGMHGS
ncbi:uncharacterized protein E0L32_011105 [Thyridium curvatum]|uniref:SH3 domain-containing protein n=1 Tax=Thyridium curvatum TaxID=1093900 RepID=A0A507ARZ0_9PEZI|nr:uncharacterized protein E0L32_011105 [Thyridium curvatum]TPX06960.1 hypothetical protein E0L32_011105 [Thyridium curvatum]